LHESQVQKSAKTKGHMIVDILNFTILNKVIGDQTYAAPISFYLSKSLKEPLKIGQRATCGHGAPI